MVLTTRKDRNADGALVIPDAPAPWTLNYQKSWTFLFPVDPKKTQMICRDPQEAATCSDYGFGLALTVRYQDSPVGPYDEVLIGLPVKTPVLRDEILPGYRIPVIYVSTEASVRNGRKNWGIRKELANFKWETQTGLLFTTTKLQVTDRLTSKVLFEATITTLNFFLPLPAPMGLFGKLIPQVVEQKMDEDGNVEDNVWRSLRIGGFSWVQPAYLSSYKAFTSPGTPAFPSFTDLGIFLGLSMSGTLQFGVPQTFTVK